MQGEFLKSAIDDLKEKVYNLRLFDRKEEIDVYCDELQSQVLVSVESMISTVNQLKDELLTEIEKYRVKLVESYSMSVIMDASNSEYNQVKRDLARLSQEVDDFGAKTSEQFTRQLVDRPKACQSQIDKFKNNAQEIRRRLRADTFNREFLKFSEGIFGQPMHNLFAKLQICGQDIEEELRIKHFDLREHKAKAMSLTPLTSKRSERNIDFKFPVYLLDGSIIASISWCNSTVLINLKKENRPVILEKVTINEYRPKITVVVQLPSGNITAGTSDGHIIIWNSVTSQHVATLESSLPNIQTLKVSPEGKLVCKCENKIVIIDPSMKQENAVCFSISPASSSFHSFEVLSNDHLAAIDLNDQYQVWDLKAHRKVRSGMVFKDQPGKRWILSNGEVVLTMESGLVRMFNLIKGTATREFIHDRGNVVDVRLQPDGTLLFVHLAHSYLNGFHRRDNTFITRDIEIESLIYSPNGKSVAADAGKSVLLIWLLKD